MNFKKVALAGILGAIAIGALAGCGGEEKKAAQASAKPEKIIAGLDDTFAPMGFRDDNGTIVGFDVDMAKAVSKEIGVPIEFKPIDWASKEAEITAGRIDCIWNGFTVTEERKKVLDYTDAYLNNTQVFVVLAGSDVQEAGDLKGRNVCAQEGSTSETAMNKQPEVRDGFGTWKLYPDFSSCFMDLEAGRMDAILGDSVLINYYMQKKPGAFRVLPGVVANEEYAVGVKKGNENLVKLLNDGFKKVEASGEAAKISEKWFGTDLTIKK